MDYSKKEVLKNIIEQAVYAHFTEEERQYISIEKYTEDLVMDIEDFLELMIDEISWRLHLIAVTQGKEKNQWEIDEEDPTEDRETDTWHFEK